MKLINQKVTLKNNQLELIYAQNQNAKKGTMAYNILQAHNTSGDENNLKIKFDAIASHDITYVGIISTARASGLKEFPLPYVMTNCHNSLCAVGGTINEDDHVFGYSAAKKYGGIFVPANVAVIHSIMREKMAGCGKMILGSDSHTRYGAIGTLAIGEGGPELVKQLLQKTYDITYPQIVAVKLIGKLNRGVGPQDVALALIGAAFANGFVKNKVLEFIGDGIANLSMDERNAIDVMTTETTCLSSIWVTDEKTKEYLALHGRESEYYELKPQDGAEYDSAIEIDLSKIVPMIAMPFHPSNVYELQDVIDNPHDILSKVEKEAEKQSEGGIKLNLFDKVIGGKVAVGQAVIAGCAGGNYTSIAKAANILKNSSCGNGAFNLSVYAGSQAIYLDLLKKGYITDLILAGAILKPSFCGPCFGAGDIPANNSLSIRHTTRNFPSREGSKPKDKQIAGVALMDALSIAATSKNGGFLASAATLDYDEKVKDFEFDDSVYNSRIYYGFGKPDKNTELIFAPSICDWPMQIPLADNMLIGIASAIFDEVTTTDELIPSGETSSYRSNPHKLAEFTLSRKDPGYVERAKEIREQERLRQEGKKGKNISEEYNVILSSFGEIRSLISPNSSGNLKNINIGSGIFGKKIGDGSAREQAASCQRVLGGICNIANSYATKRYRSNLINWGMIPFVTEDTDFKTGDFIFVTDIINSLKNNKKINARLLREGKVQEIELKIDSLTDDEKQILIDGCLINYYSKTN